LRVLHDRIVLMTSGEAGRDGTVSIEGAGEGTLNQAGSNEDGDLGLMGRGDNKGGYWGEGLAGISGEDKGMKSGGGVPGEVSIVKRGDRIKSLLPLLEE
jgi:hypothetical protein